MQSVMQARMLAYRNVCEPFRGGRYVSADFILIIFARINFVERAKIVTYLSVAIVGLYSLPYFREACVRCLGVSAYSSLTFHFAAELITCLMCLTVDFKGSPRVLSLTHSTSDSRTGTSSYATRRLAFNFQIGVSNKRDTFC